MDAKIEGTASEYSSPAIDAFWTMSVNMWQMDVRTSGLLGWAAITPVERKRRGRGERRRETERDGEEWGEAWGDIGGEGERRGNRNRLEGTIEITHHVHQC